MDPTRPSLASIAAEVGVSTASVSHALNRPELVSAGLLARVREVATRVGYAGPAAALRKLPSGRAEAIGIIFTAELPRALGDPAAVEFLQGLSTACEHAGVAVTLIPEVALQPGRRLSMVASAMVDGFIVYSLRDRDPLLDAVLRRDLPTVVVDAPRDPAGGDWVGCDDRSAARALGRYLSGLGHHRVGVIAPQLAVDRHNGTATADRWIGSGYTLMAERLIGLTDGLGINTEDVVVQERFEASAAAGADALHALLDGEVGLTAVCALTDVLALGALAAARVRGLRVPEDVTITGFDDVPEADRSGLTTVAQPQVEKGRVAAELLLSAGRGDRRRRLLPTHLQVRGTSGIAR